MNTVDDLVGLFERRGASMYGGEAVTQLEHSLQCALLAEESGATPELVSACLLHDVGHLIEYERDGSGLAANDDLHQYIAIPFLRPLFSMAVLEPIRLHVDAKRYLCFADPDYWTTLSPLSKRSLELQGGVFDEVGAATFIRQPYARDALQLRLWDDRAKIPAMATPEITHFASILRSCATDPRHIGRVDVIASGMA